VSEQLASHFNNLTSKESSPLSTGWEGHRKKACAPPTPTEIEHTWSNNKVRELIAVKVLHTSLLNTTMVAFKVLPLGRYTLMPVPSPPFKTILELALRNDLQSCRCITPYVINMPSFQYFLYLQEQKKVIGGYIWWIGSVFQHSYLFSS